MTREEAKREMLFAKREVVDDSWIDKAYDVAIEALSEPERKKGTWKTAYLDHEAFGERPCIFYCSECNQCIAYPVNFCPSCGADMRSKNG